MLLDYLKGALPVYLIIRFGHINDFWLAPIAIAPVLGHAFSLFMQFKGGKANATTFGVWTALTFWQVPVVFGLALILLKVIFRIKNDAWSTILGMLCIFIFLLFRNASPILLAVFLLNFIIVAYKHKQALRLVKPHTA
jgi:glycerol-3-phosphate acyltransferase PlsY